MSSSLALFLQQCLTEEKYGTGFVSEIDQRLETLNYTQLSRMNEVLSRAAEVAKVKVWKEGNNEVLGHVQKWLIIRKKEHDQIVAREAEVLRKIRHRQKMKELNEREKERVIIQLRDKAHNTATHEIKDLEIKRKAEYKEKLYEVVEQAERRRNYHILFGLFFLIAGCVICGLFIKDILILLGIIGGIVLISLLIFYRAYRVSYVAPYDDHPDTIQKQIHAREKELFHKSMEIIRQHEREYDEKMEADKRERKERKKRRKREEEIQNYLENHPEIVLKGGTPEEIEQQLHKYLQKNDPSYRHLPQDQEEGEEEDEAETVPREGGGEEEKKKSESKKPLKKILEKDDDDERSSEDEKERETKDQKRKRKAGKANSRPDIAPGKDDEPETIVPSRQNSKRNQTSGKYLLDEEEQREREREGERDIEEGGGGIATALIQPNKVKQKPVKYSLQIQQIVLSNFLSSFLESFSSDYGEISLSLSLSLSLALSPTLSPSASVSVSSSSLESSLLYQTDSQRCVGESVLWRSDPKKMVAISSETGIGSVFSSLSLLVTSSQHTTLQFQIRCTRQPNTILGTGTITTDDLMTALPLSLSGPSPSLSFSFQLVRNDVIKICDISLSYSLSPLHE